MKKYNKGIKICYDYKSYGKRLTKKELKKMIKELKKSYKFICNS